MALKRRIGQISLTSREEEVFSVLLKVGSTYGATIRAAGGWVRDKLLGLESDDIDVALDTCDGETFAHAVREYALKETQLNVSAIGEIKANPDKSKHLQTATFVLNGISLDTNNLRSETYTQDSRIPQTRFGTPLEDSERRDFTINSMFYNANTGEIEDFTQKGLSDLEHSLLRTPLPPRQTFSDDPLRIVRALRFAARFNLTIDSDLSAAISDRSISSSLTVKKDKTGVTISKVSGERIGTELTKMFNSTKTAGNALTLLVTTGVADAICDSQPVDTGDKCDWFALSNLNHPFTLTDRQDRILHFALLTSRLRDQQSFEGKRRVNTASSLLKETLRVPKNEAELVGLIFDNLEKLSILITLQDKVETGRLLRVLKDDWVLACSVLAVLRPSADIINFNSWVKTESGLDGCWTWKPLFDGVYLHEKLQVPKSKRLAELLDFQLDLMCEGEITSEAMLTALQAKLAP